MEKGQSLRHRRASTLSRAQEREGEREGTARPPRSAHALLRKSRRCAHSRLLTINDGSCGSRAKNVHHYGRKVYRPTWQAIRKPNRPCNFVWSTIHRITQASSLGCGWLDIPGGVPSRKGVENKFENQAKKVAVRQITRHVTPIILG